MCVFPGNFTRSCSPPPLFFSRVFRMTDEALQQLVWLSTSPSNNMKTNVVSCCWGRRLLITWKNKVITIYIFWGRQMNISREKVHWWVVKTAWDTNRNKETLILRVKPPSFAEGLCIYLGKVWTGLVKNRVVRIFKLILKRQQTFNSVILIIQGEPYKKDILKPSQTSYIKIQEM